MTNPDIYAQPYSSLTFRYKVFLYYRDAKVLPASADLLAKHYLSAMFRAKKFDPDSGPTLSGCEEFEPEASPREIIRTFCRMHHPEIRGRELAELTDAMLALAEQEIHAPRLEVATWRYKPPMNDYCKVHPTSYLRNVAE
jgi:hypothetical protein